MNCYLRFGLHYWKFKRDQHWTFNQFEMQTQVLLFDAVINTWTLLKISRTANFPLHFDFFLVKSRPCLKFISWLSFFISWNYLSTVRVWNYFGFETTNVIFRWVAMLNACLITGVPYHRNAIIKHGPHNHWQLKSNNLRHWLNDWVFSWNKLTLLTCTQKHVQCTTW